MVGWKDILRPIRDGLRDQLPPRKPKEDKDEAEKRRRRRESDVLKGFAYLEDFEEVENWAPHKVDPLQRANTPLLARPQAQSDPLPKAKVILIHDYAGNYHEYEACQGSLVVKESYSCEYMQFVDIFVYFSHKLICVPPPTWTNSLHRNGVKCLGTFLFEPQSPNIGKILERKDSTKDGVVWEYPVATRLVEMAKVYGFDGWLINIEKTFPYIQWDCEKMLGFLAQLRSQLGHGNVIWYDALTTSNTLQYQNSLTMKNLPFAKAAGVLLTNYAWTPEKATASSEIALAHAMDPMDVAFGIDVWAQNTPSKEYPRSTYGGGGTGTGIAVGKLAELGFAAGVFAPAWPFEHFAKSSKAVQRSMWCGDELPENVDCNCDRPTRHAIDGYRTNTILDSAQAFPAGSDTFFYTNFERAFSDGVERETTTAHVGSASVLPILIDGRVVVEEGLEAASSVTGKLLSNPPRVAITVEKGRYITSLMKLFDLRMTGYLEVAITYRKGETPEGLQIGLDLMTETGDHTRIRVPLEACSRVQIRKVLECTDASNHLTSIGVHIESKDPEAEMTSSLAVIEILEICITQRGVDSARCTITDPHLERCRLLWSFEAEHGSSSLPYSRITGPFSHFEIYVDEKLTGRAYALEYIISTDSMAQPGDGEAHLIKIAGVGFDGRLLTSCLYQSRDARQEESLPEEWQLVQRPL